jgi:cell division protein FtsA
LVEDEQELGAVCIDFGGGSTSYSIFLKKHMIFAGSINLGGNHVTRDISLGLQVPMAVAEKIKTKNGGLIATGIDDRDLIEVGGETGDWEHDRRTVTRSELIGIMRPRIEEILEDVRAQLEIAGFYELKSQKFVLTGGTSQAPGLDTLASRILGQQVRIGRPLRIHRLPQAYSGSSCSALVGLALFAAHPQDEWWDFELPNSSYSSRTVRKAVRWLRENW